MNRKLDMSVALGYISKSQIARVVTENWAKDNLYCPICGYEKILPYPNNEKVADFYCPCCKEDFQLKSSSKTFGKRFPGSEYYTLIDRIEKNEQPNLFLMVYSLELQEVMEITFIPRVFFLKSIIEKRNPLSESARRAGWTGCNIRLDAVPTKGKIEVLTTEIEIINQIVMSRVRKITSLYCTDSEEGGWHIEILNILNTLPNMFTIEDIYKAESYLSSIFTENNNIKAQIRKQLQLLRDNGILTFESRGVYKKAD